MSRQASSVRYVVRGGADQARAVVEEFFTSRGWKPRTQVDGTLAYECGSRRRTILLGALAGKKFFLTAVTDVRDDDGTAVIDYLWGPRAGLALGGTIGRSRADRVHTQMAAELETHLRHGGHLVEVRR